MHHRDLKLSRRFLGSSQIGMGLILCMGTCYSHARRLHTCALPPCTQQAGNVDQALEAYEKAATAQDKIGSSWHAAKHLESAADLCRQHKLWERVKDYSKQAADLYINSGKGTIGG
jgi:hypothetical protein